MRNRKATRLLICDLDNTLYDWVGYFVPAFYEMIEKIVEISACNREELLDDFREVHRKHHDSEHPFALLETNTVQRMYPEATVQEIADIFDPAFHAFNSSRKRNLALYPGAMSGIQAIHASGITLVAHTESKLFSATGRIQRLGLTEYFSRLYCREASKSSHPSAGSFSKPLNDFPQDRVNELRHHQRKPNVHVVTEICEREGVPASESAYVGDSIARDIMMANDAGIFSIWAKYGSNSSKEEYEKLVRISHWSDEDVVRERLLAGKAQGVRPNAVLENSFDEILDHINSHEVLERS